jgi:phosphoenolpyruvate-protein kinase (PTS system EI component)
MTTLHKIILAILSLAISFSIGYFATPTKIKTETVVKTETVKVEGKTRIVYRNKVTKPDGTITESEVEKEDTNTREESKSVAESKSTVSKDAGAIISILAIVDSTDIAGQREYGLNVSKRVLGSLTVTGLVTTDKRLGVGLGWSF